MLASGFFIFYKDLDVTSNMDLMKSPRIRLHLNIHEPIELIDMTVAFQGLCYEFQNYVKTLEVLRERERLNRQDIDEPINSSDVKLYITKIENNCILAELAAGMQFLAPAVPFIQNVSDINGFVNNIKDAIEFFKGFGKSKTKEIKYSKAETKHIKDLVDMVGKSKDGELGLSSIEYKHKSGEDEVSLDVRFNKSDCEKASIGANKAINILEAKGHADYEKVVMYLHTTSREEPKSGGNTSHRALINSISNKPKRVHVLSDVAKSKIQSVQDDKGHNPLLIGFVVDVNVETNPKGEPILYRVLNVYETIEDGEDVD